MAEYVGLDVSKEETSFCVKDEGGRVVASDPDALFEVLREHYLCPQRIVLETGTLSAWLARELRKLGLPVEVIDARQAHAVMKLQHNKTDAGGAELLAEIARTGFCRAVSVASEAAQELRILLKARAHLVRQRRDTENTIRDLLGSLGIRCPKGTGKLVGRVRAALEARADLKVTIEPLLSAVATLKREIERLDKAVMARAKAAPACRLLMSVPGVGPVTALAFAVTIDDPRRFAKSRAVGAYLGLTTRRFQCGEMDYSGRISKHGDAMVRSLLYKAHPLKDEGLRGAGAQAGRDPAPQADHRRGVPLAGKTGRRNGVNERGGDDSGSALQRPRQAAGQPGQCQGLAAVHRLRGALPHLSHSSTPLSLSVCSWHAMIRILRNQHMGREGSGAWTIFSQQLQAMRGRTMRFTTKRPGTNFSSSVTSSPSVFSLPVHLLPPAMGLEEGLSCHSFRNNEVRLQLHALAYDLGNFLRTLALPQDVEHWSLTKLRSGTS